MRILIVEDNEQDMKILERQMKRAGFDDLICSSSGEDGVIKGGDGHPSIAVIDTVLPGIDGFEVSRRIKRANPAIKVIIVTGQVDAVDAVEARKAGADDYVVKTADSALIVGAVKRLAEQEKI